MNSTHIVVRDVLLAALCFWAVGRLLVRSDEYARLIRVVFILAFAVVGIALVVDLVWPIRAVVLIALAGLCLAMEIGIMLSPSADLPQSYVWTLRLGWAITFLAACLLAVLRMGLVPYSLVFYLEVGIAALIGAAVSVVAYVALRPKDRPWNGGVL